MLCDKLLLAASSRVIEELIVFNKADAASRDDTAAYAGEYSARYQTLIVSARTGANMDRLGDMLSGKISCFAGQSAVGKSSLLNALLPKLNLPVGELARRTARGRHTTRHAELWPYRSGAVLDTPGFSLLDLPEMGQDTLNACYRDFGDAPARCKFAACSHRSEPGCAVKALVGKSLAYGRYERYVALCSQLEEMRQHKYD
jgi:ribosome biogenesis GTPase